MKRWILAIMIVAGTSLAHSQSADSSRRGERGGERTVASGSTRRTDRFIDKDGDGISDARVSGLGLRRGGQGMHTTAGSGIGAAGQGRGRQLQKGRKN